MRHRTELKLWPANLRRPSSSRPTIQPMSFVTTVAQSPWAVGIQWRDSSRQIEPYPRRMKYEYIPCNTRFTFANGQTSKVDWTLRLSFNTSPPVVTFIDILEQGQVPILLSIDQMRNLHMTIEHTPQCDKITCKAFGMIRQPIPVSSSGHAMFDLAAFCRQHDARTANKAVDDNKINPIAYP